MLKLITVTCQTLAQKDVWTGSRSKTGIPGKDFIEENEFFEDG